MAGRRLGDRYELVQRVGTGGMAEVWEALDTSLGRKVAVKLLHRHLAEDPAVLTRFRTEAQAAARLTHPGIVAIYDTVSDEDGTDALVMELVDGQDLRTILDERRSLAVDDAIEVTMQLANALAQAHQGGIVHRDIKPANILVRPDRRVKLSDFGIAKALGSTTHTEAGSVVGTMKYLAPEQIEGAPVDGRTDLYALTTVMFEMLCGQVPFDAQDLAAAMSRVSRDAPRARSIRPELSPSVDDFLARGLARDPNDRPADAASYAAELAAVRRGDTTPRRPERPAAAPVASPGPAHQPVSIPMREPIAAEIPTPAKRGFFEVVGPIIAAGLMIAAVITVWLLLRPTEDGSTDTTGAPPTEAPATTTDPTTTADESADTSGGTEATEDDGSSLDSDGQASSTTDSTTSTTTTTLPEFDNGMRALAIDPAGDGEEHGDIASRALDGNLATSWNTERYNSRLFGRIKEGVGFVIELEDPTAVAALDVVASNTDWSARIYEADRVETVLENWGEPIASYEGLGTEASLEIPRITTSAVLLWITDLGEGELVDDRLRLELYEVSLVS